MVNEAIQKLKNEIESSKNNRNIKAIGEYLINYVKVHEDAAEKILNKDKTISKSIEAMRKEAEKVKVGNCAMLSDQEGFNIVLRYFDIEDKEPVKSETYLEQAPKPIEKAKTEFNINLDDLL